MYIPWLLIAAALYTIICTIIKPDHYWNSRKARSMRRLIGDTASSIFYILVGIGLLVFGIISLMNGGIQFQ